MEIHWTSILAEGRLWQSLLLEVSIYDTSGVLALAGHDRRAPISDEVVVEYKRFPDSASMVTYTKNVQYCHNDGPRLVKNNGENMKNPNSWTVDEGSTTPWLPRRIC